MGLKDFMAKLRYLDNLTAKWILRNFYFTFFQIVLTAIFLIWLLNTIQFIDLSFQTSMGDIPQQLQITMAINVTILVVLLFLNSFWLLYIFSSIKSLTNILKDISYAITRLRSRDR